MRASQSSDVSIMVRPTSLMTPAPETYVLSQTRALCSTVRRTRASLYIEEKRDWCELFDASRPGSYGPVHDRPIPSAVQRRLDRHRPSQLGWRRAKGTRQEP